MPLVQFSDEVEEQEIDPYSNSLRAEEANQFDTVCDGVVNCLAYLHEANQEFLEFKDELMQHLLPSTVLLRLSLVSGNIYRSISDLNVPLNELLRMVRVYSAPWQEKSDALKKLHEDYSKKTAQLNIALQKLANQEFEAKRLKKERRLLNWEKLFTRVELCKGHGRRWKFRMHDFREKAEQGREHLSAYYKLGDDQKTDNPDLSRFNIPRRKTLFGEKSESSASDEEETVVQKETKSKSFSPILPKEPLKVKEVQVDDLPRAPSPEPPPDTTDACVWTNEPVYQETLHLRLYNPELINQSDLNALLYFGDESYKVNDIDKPTQIENLSRSQSSLSSQSKKGGLIGSKAKIEQAGIKTVKYKEIAIPIPSEVRSGQVQNPNLTSIRIKILKQGSHVPIAVCTIDMDDLKNLEIPSVKSTDESSVATFHILPELEPVPFPLYPYSENAAVVDSSIGEIPVALYWEKSLVSGSVDKDTATVSVNDLVLEMTGIDLNVISKDDIVLRKITEDKNLSPRPQTPPPETVLKSVFDEMIEQKQTEIDFMQQQYSLRLQELETTIAENVPPPSESRGNSPHRKLHPSPPPRHSASMQTSPVKERPPEESRSKRSSLRSKTPDSGGKRSKTPDGRKSRTSVSGRPASQHSEVRFTSDATENEYSQKPIASIHANTPANEINSAMISKTISCKQSKPTRNTNLPSNAFERMALLDDQAQKHKEEYIRRAKAEEAKEIELALAQSYKMDRNWDRARVSLDTHATSAAGVESALRDVTLPALFSQQRNAAGTLYNPRAHQYFHPIGLKNIRLTQPPSMVALPPIKNEISVLNLFNIADHIRNRHYLDPYGADTGSGGGQHYGDEPNPVGPQPTAFITEDN